MSDLRTRSPRAGAAPSETLFWVDQVVGRIPYEVRHLVRIDRLQPQPTRMESWDVEPVHATARVKNDRQVVEVTFVGAFGVTFHDLDGEMHRARQSFTLRREFLTASAIPPYASIQVLAEGACGDGDLVPAGRPTGFRGHVDLSAALFITEPTLWRGDPGEPVTAADFQKAESPPSATTPFAGDAAERPQTEKAASDPVPLVGGPNPVRAPRPMPAPSAVGAPSAEAPPSPRSGDDDPSPSPDPVQEPPATTADDKSAVPTAPVPAPGGPSKDGRSRQPIVWRFPSS